MEQQQMIQRILELKKQHNAVILAHNYQIGQIQDIADFVGDSFALSRQAAQTDADVIVFCGVRFMAESAKILSPDKTVILPVAEAGCPLADMASPEQLWKVKAQHPNVPVVTYVNSTADVKALSDVCCTSSNAVKVVNSLQSEKVIFVPDRNLGRFVQKHTSKQVILWEGFCPVHQSLKVEDVEKARQLYPQALILIHPEAKEEVLALADYVGSTGQMLEFVRKSNHDEFVIGTEQGILHTLQKQNPQKKFYLLSPKLLCTNMKKITLESLLRSLETLQPRIELSEEIRQRAKLALDRMLEIS